VKEWPKHKILKVFTYNVSYNTNVKSWNIKCIILG